jgi:hypothetical protein
MSYWLSADHEGILKRLKGQKVPRVYVLATPAISRLHYPQLKHGQSESMNQRKLIFVKSRCFLVRLMRGKNLISIV